MCENSTVKLPNFKIYNQMKTKLKAEWVKL